MYVCTKIGRLEGTRIYFRALMIYGAIIGTIGFIVSHFFRSTEDDHFEDHINISMPIEGLNPVDEPVYVTVVCGKSAHRYCPFRFRSLQNLIGVPCSIFCVISKVCRVCINIETKTIALVYLLFMSSAIDLVPLSFICSTSGVESTIMTSILLFRTFYLRLLMNGQYVKERVRKSLLMGLLHRPL